VHSATRPVDFPTDKGIIFTPPIYQHFSNRYPINVTAYEEQL
jgi:hypothetical protein